MRNGEALALRLDAAEMNDSHHCRDAQYPAHEDPRQLRKTSISPRSGVAPGSGEQSNGVGTLGEVGGGSKPVRLVDNPPQKAGWNQRGELTQQNRERRGLIDERLKIEPTHQPPNRRKSA